MIKRTAKFLFFALVIFASTSRAQVPPVRGLYINFVNAWIGDSIEESKILNYCSAYGFNYITIYDLNLLSWSVAQKNSLASFISRAKNQYGVTQVGAAGETYNFFNNLIVPYNTGRTTAAEKFDVFNYEFEFWLTASIASYYGPNYLTPNGFTADTAGAFAFALQQFTRIDSLSNVYGTTTEIYLGWPNQGQMQQLTQHADRILLHAYRTSNIDVYQYTQSRIYDIASANKAVQVMPIFSSEPNFMGPWLATNPITLPFQTYDALFKQESAAIKQNISLQGYQWFLYSLMPKSSLANASISSSGPLSFCSGGSVTLTASTGSSYLWSPGGQTTNSIVVNSSGNYSVTVTGASGNSATSPAVAVSVTNSGPVPTISASGPTSFCVGGNVTLSTAAAASYLWSNNQTTQSITVSSSGNYTVRTTNNGCSQTSAVTVVLASTTPPVPTITANGALNICPGRPLTLTSSASSGYLWSNGATTRSIVVSGAGNYSVRAFAGPNCYANSVVKTVTQLSPPATPVISLNGSASLNSSHRSVVLTSTSANSYSWSTLQTSRSITVNTQGSYRVTVASSNGCAATSLPVSISANGCTPPAVPTISASGSTVLTAGQSVTLTSTLAGGYLWSNGATTRSLVVSTAGTYSVRAYNAGSCYATSLPVNVIVVSARLAQTPQSTKAFSDELIVFPNPAREFISVRYQSASTVKNTLCLFDLAGREMLRKEFLLQEGENLMTLELAGIQSGLYFVSLENNPEQKLRIVIE
ncbi:MAG TPA: T9SS type A sorting domain-containing protein [Bacteroidia bacterium]|nr:T9SS type A sorting domain-containing protein [Bacteroidia bacterium]